MNAYVETTAKAIQTVPGFERLLWKAAEMMHQANNAQKEEDEYKATHKSYRNKHYAALTRCASGSHGRACATLDAVDIILESINPLVCDYAHEEVREIVKSADWHTCHRHAWGW